MNSPNHMIEDIEGLPYKNVPEINFFYYPPVFLLDAECNSDISNIVHFDDLLDGEIEYPIYISIPYCRIRCNSCHCFKGMLPPNKEQIEVLDRYVEALISQIEAYGSTPRYKEAKFGAVYIGGGTGSTLFPEHLERIFNTLKLNFTIVDNAEITLEGSPDDFSTDYLLKAKALGVTRLSIGYQSANDKILETLNSPHRSDAGVRSMNSAMSVNFDTVNIDLLYNVPGQSFEDFQRDLELVIETGSQSISPGDYVVWTGSRAEHLINNGKLPKQHNAEVIFEWYLYASKILNDAGYSEQVRGIFTKPDHRQKYIDLCCHGDILSFGSGSYSFIGKHQLRNIVSVKQYEFNMNSGNALSADLISNTATEKNLWERFVVLNLFSSEITLYDFKKKFGLEIKDAFPEIINKLKKYGFIEVSYDCIRLTVLGKKWRRNVYYEFYGNEYVSDRIKVIL
ncbi:hypothetical protein AB835_06685 [Candidatus Endobugula sertula]|uniref:Radical SAM core domain-containing protein n=1 Tax=Candidatus Endobugula sertula TaxID=62101 RepID=A0A1D2QQK2_9GAMM|nr:hypothetical protein AB835_06685 [Candidatus Endobugula sertula]